MSRSSGNASVDIIAELLAPFLKSDVHVHDVASAVLEAMPNLSRLIGERYLRTTPFHDFRELNPPPSHIIRDKMDSGAYDVGIAIIHDT